MSSSRTLYSAIFILTIAVVACSACRRAIPPQPINVTPPSTPRPVQVTGQVFIVLKNRESIKLSLTDIYLLDLSQAVQLGSAIHNKKATQLDAPLKEKKRLEDQLTSLQSQMSPIKKELDEASSKSTQIFNARMKLSVDKIQGDNSGNPDAVPLYADKIAALKKADEPFSDTIHRLSPAFDNLSKVIKNLQGDLTLIDKSVAKLSPVANYFDISLLKPLAKTTTDVDGKFNIPLPNGSAFAIAAYTERVTDGATEKYAWLVKIESGQTVLTLNNNNMVDADDPSGLVPK